MRPDTVDGSCQFPVARRMPPRTTTMTHVRTKVAKSELTLSSPTLAKIAVRAAKAAERSAQASQESVRFPIAPSNSFDFREGRSPLEWVAATPSIGERIFVWHITSAELAKTNLVLLHRRVSAIGRGPTRKCALRHKVLHVDLTSVPTHRSEITASPPKCRDRLTI